MVSAGIPGRSEATSGQIRRVVAVNACVNRLARLAATVTGAIDGVRCEEVVLNAQGLTALEIVPTDAAEDRVLLYFHGGAHMLFTPFTHRELLGRLAKQLRTRVVAVDYRKAPGNPFPAALDDALHSWRCVRAQWPGARMAVGGDSAGGNLTFSLLLRLSRLGLPMPVGAFGFSPWLLLHKEDPAAKVPKKLKSMVERWERNAQWFADLYVGKHSPADPLVSPALATEDEVSRFPPVLIHASEGEALSTDAKEMASLCRQAGVPVEFKLYRGNSHVLQAYPLLYPRACRDSLSRLRDFLEVQWACPPRECAEPALAVV